MAFEKVKTSVYRDNIEKMMVQGQSPRKISLWLKSQGESISYLTILRYRDQEFNFTEAAAKEMQTTAEDSEHNFLEGKRSVMADICYCNKIIELAEKKIQEVHKDESKINQVKIFHDAAIKSIETKLRIINGGIDHETNIHIESNIEVDQLHIDFDKRVRRIKELRDYVTKKVSD